MSELLDDAVRELSRLPGIGRRTALRLTLHMLRMDEEEVRRMTAAVGLPTLRLVRVRIGDWTIEGLDQGQYKEVPARL